MRLEAAMVKSNQRLIFEIGRVGIEDYQSRKD
jgi:hypothetical protein